jgi:hypothetical protein
MKYALVILLFCCSICPKVKAQADILAMIKQIALYGIYIEDLEKGINIAKEGLTTISEIKHGEFNLHTLFFNSLQTVNPAVSKYSKIGEIISDQLAIIASFKTLIKTLNNAGRLTSSEMAYINSVYNYLTNECTKSLADLIAVTTDGKLQMTDDERIKRIDGIYTDTKDKYAFTQKFTGQVSRLSVERAEDKNETELLKSLE